MVSVAAHNADTTQLKQLMQREQQQLDQIQRYLDVELQTTHLYYSAESVRKSMDVLTCLQPQSSELARWCSFIAEARTALFTVARKPESNHWRLLDKERVLIGKPPAEALQAAAWRSGFWLAWATRDAHALALLSQVPPSLIAETESFDRPMVEALQGMMTASPETGALIAHALDLTDPAKVKRTNPDWVLNILVPVFECLVPIIDHDEKRFESALVKLLELRREFFAQGLSKGSTQLQFLSDEGIGLIAWAKAVGLQPNVDSPYLPAALTDLSPPPVNACPECVTPGRDKSAVCDACEHNFNDDHLHFGFEEWLSLDRDECRSCSYRFPVIGTKCPRCLTPKTGMA